MDQPLLTQLLAEKWAAKAQRGKPTALGTPLRYSSALGCARQMSYYALDARETNPMDCADAWAPGIGTSLHECAQEVIFEVFGPQAKFEVASRIGKYISGSCDALVKTQALQRFYDITFGGTDVLWELKTMGEYAFDQQVGFKRMGQGSRTTPQGPKLEAITQAGLNAVGLEETLEDVHIETILMGSVCTAPLSVQKAASMGVEGFDRIGAEFRIPRETWFPLAQQEITRMNTIGLGLDAGVLGDRETPSQFLNPRGRDWQCAYCSFKDLCISDGEGAILAAQSWLDTKTPF